MPGPTASEPRKKPKQKRSKETVEAIIEATTRILEQEGFDKTSTNRVAKRAGVSIGSLYQYFPNKEALVLAVFERHCEEMLGLLQRSVLELASSPIEEAVCSYVRAMLEAHAVNPELHQVLSQQVVHLGWDHLAQVQQMACSIVKQYLELHQDQILPKSLDLAAFVLVTSVESITHAAILELDGAYDMGALEQELCSLILRYLLGSEGVGRCGQGEA